MFKILTVSGAPPQTPRGSLRRSPDPLVARGFLPSAIASSRLRRLQFPHGLKSNSVKEQWPMRLGGGICAKGLGGIDAPGLGTLAYHHVLGNECITVMYYGMETLPSCIRDWAHLSINQSINQSVY